MFFYYSEGGSGGPFVDKGATGRASSFDAPLASGAELYAEPSVTGLNTQPVDDHQALALLGARIATSGSAAPDIQQLAVRLLAEGSVALVREEYLQGGAGVPAS